MSQDQRPRFYEGQYLGADDLTATVTFTRVAEARPALGGHAWGIAAGLQLQEVPATGGGGSVDVFVRPGYAWDGFARPIVVLAPYKVPPELFQSFSYDPSNPDGVLVDIWLRYDEQETGPPQPGFQTCENGDMLSRIVESFRVEVGPRTTLAARRDNVSIAGRSIDPQLAYQAFDPGDGLLRDESVPFQDFPYDGPPATWLIPLGQVRWRPNPVANQPGSFAPRTPADLTSSRARRVYVGVVAERVLAADGFLRLTDRTRDFTQGDLAAQDFVRVEGALRAQGDIRFWGTRAAFLDTKGYDQGTPLAILRKDDSAGTRRIDVQIGTATAGANRFGVGPYDSTTKDIAEAFVVLDNGNVGIGTTAPIAPLQVPGKGIQVGVSTTPTENFYFAAETAGGRSAFRLYNKDMGTGVPLLTVFQNGHVGIGTTRPITGLQVPEVGIQIGVSVTASDNFHFVSDTNATRGLRLYNGNYGTGTHLLTVLPGGNVGIGSTTLNPTLKLQVEGDYGSPNVASTLSLWGSRIGDVGAGILFLRSGGSVVTLDKPGNRLGIGTSAPGETLDVAGNVLALTNANPLRISSAYADFPPFVLNAAQICNDTAGENALVIAGNRSATGWFGSRRVKVLDDLDVAGVATKPGGGTWTTPSDAALKQNIRPLANALETLLKLRGVEFEWKDPARMGGLPGVQRGLVAQDVEAVIPDWVSTGTDGLKQLTVRGFEALAIEAIRGLTAEVEELRTRVGELTDPNQPRRRPDGPRS